MRLITAHRILIVAGIAFFLPELRLYVAGRLHASRRLRSGL